MTSTNSTFIHAHTRPRPVPFVPEIRLLQADDPIALWVATEQNTTTAVTQPEGFLPPPFWAFAWAGGQALARYVLDNPGLVAGRTVLDLASGSGLVAIAAALAGAGRVTANEIDEYATEVIALNAAINQVPIEVIAGDLLDNEPPQVDVVLAGDVFYRRPMARRVSRFLELALRSGADAVVGDPGRAYLPRERLIPLAEYVVPVAAELEDTAVKAVGVWRFPPDRRADALTD